MDADWERIVELFDRAADLPPAQRADFLRGQCMDAGIVRRVEALLHHHDNVGEGFLGGGGDGTAADANDATKARRSFAEPVATHFSSGACVGSYRIRSVLGEGGMGTVYEAEQDHPRRRVALKVVRPALLTASALKRFHYEAEVLGRLEHPGIARIYETGIVDSAFGQQPFFAMELVEGLRLDQWIARQRPSLRARLALIVEIGEAVHYAHTKGVIHRDLKPSNILVTPDARPRILDFGIARVIDVDVGQATLQTEPGQLLGTLPYMSPEQAAGRWRELDTSSDVYALGVVAYELLSGRLPYVLDDQPLHEAVRLICEQEPTRLTTINRSLCGDVETILRKAMEKQPSRRYRTGGEMAADVRRFLQYEPITTRPAGVWYQLRRFARRNKLAVGSVAGMFVLLLLGIVGTSYGLVRAHAQRAEAERQHAQAAAVVRFLTENVLSAAAPERTGDKAARDTVIRVMLEPVAASIGKDFADQPLTQAAVRNTLALCYRALGRADLGLPHATAALESRRRALGPAHVDIAESLNTLATLLQDSGRLPEAEADFRAALDMRRQLRGDDHPETVTSLDNLAVVLLLQGRLREAEPMARRAMEHARRAFGDDSQDTVAVISNLAMILKDQDKLDDAERLFRESLADARRTAAGADGPAILKLVNNLGALLHDKGDLAGAEQLFAESRDKSIRILGPDHPDTMRATHNLATVLREERKLDRAEPLARDVLQRRRAVLGNQHLDTLSSIDGLALLLQAKGSLEPASPLMHEALEGYRAQLGNDQSQTLLAMNNLGMLLLDQGRAADAERLFADVYRGAAHAEMPAGVAAILMSRYGPCLVSLKHFDGARDPLLEARRRLHEAGLERHGAFRSVLSALAILEEHEGHVAEAAKWRAELDALPSTAPSTQPASRATTQPRA